MGKKKSKSKKKAPAKSLEPRVKALEKDLKNVMKRLKDRDPHFFK